MFTGKDFSGDGTERGVAAQYERKSFMQQGHQTPAWIVPPDEAMNEY